MTEQASGTDRFRSYLVLLATLGTMIFNWIAATGRLNGAPLAHILDKYPTPITPAGYAFSIWSLIYLGLIAFSLFQLLPAHAARFRKVRSLYILTCALNCGWIFMWHSGQIAIGLV